MTSCIFCQIVAGEAPAEIVYKDELVTVFPDNHPATPLHLLIVPNRHIPSVNDLLPEDEALVGHMVLVAQKMAAEAGISQPGYRLIINTGPQGGQTILHIHLHLIGGKYTSRRDILTGLVG